jgi:hypothetical protein
MRVVVMAVVVLPLAGMLVTVVVGLVSLVAAGVRMRVAHAPEGASKTALQHITTSHLPSSANQYHQSSTTISQAGAAAACSQQPAGSVLASGTPGAWAAMPAPT